MRRVLSLPCLTAIVTLLLLALPAFALESPQAAEEIQSVVLTIAPSFGCIDAMIDTVITLRPDNGSVLVQAVAQMDGAEETVRLAHAQKEELTALVSSLYEQGFFHMPEYLETGVLDGDFTWITVNFRNGGAKRVGGLEATVFGPENFIAVYNALWAAYKNSSAYPPWLVGARPPRDNGQKGTPLLDFCGAQDIAAKMAQEPPVRATVCVTTVAGGRPYETGDEVTVTRVAEALAGIVVYAADGWGHTDDELFYAIEWADGTRFSAAFQTGMLLGDTMELYPVMGFEALVAALPPVMEP